VSDLEPFFKPTAQIQIPEEEELFDPYASELDSESVELPKNFIF
jgi:hypothetical protein